jgi:hypothetical protein
MFGLSINILMQQNLRYWILTHDTVNPNQLYQWSFQAIEN